MKSFRQHQDDNQQAPDELIEGVLRGASAAVLFSRIHQAQKEIKRTKKIDDKIELLSKQSTNLAALVVAMTTLSPSQNKGTT
jgi:hypothetical protein